MSKKGSGQGAKMTQTQNVHHAIGDVWKSSFSGKWQVMTSKGILHLSFKTKREAKLVADSFLREYYRELV